MRVRNFRTLGGFVSLALCLGLGLLPANVAVADDGTGASTGVSTQIDDGSVLATPAEVAEYGGSVEDVSRQTAVWAGLDKATFEDQESRSREEAVQAAKFVGDQVYDVDVQAGTTTPIGERSGAPSTGISPLVAHLGCSVSPKPYEIESLDDGSHVCFGGAAGTYVLSSPRVVWRLRTQDYVGRVYYMTADGVYKWSMKRGPSETWRTFEDAANTLPMVVRVQLYSSTACTSDPC